MEYSTCTLSPLPSPPHISADIPAATTTGLASDLKAGTSKLIDTQSSLGVRAGCQLWGHYFAESIISVDNFGEYKKNLIAQGKNYCSVTAGAHRDKIADLAVGFLRDDCTVRSLSQCTGKERAEMVADI
jgi:translation initiation factor eIF-2B subunit alpha